MKTNDLELILEFLEEYCHDFQEFLETKEIESYEAEPIIDELKKEIGLKDKPGVKQAKVETDDLSSVAEIREWMGLVEELRVLVVAKFPKDFQNVMCVSTNDVVRVIKEKLKG